MHYNISSEQKAAAIELSNAEVSLSMFERYNPKYVPAAKARLRKAQENVMRLMKEAVKNSEPIPCNACGGFIGHHRMWCEE